MFAAKIEVSIMSQFLTAYMNSFKGNISFFKGWLNFSSLKVLELLPAKARHNFFEILKLYIKLYIVQAEKQTMMPQAV